MKPRALLLGVTLSCLISCGSSDEPDAGFADQGLLDGGSSADTGVEAYPSGPFGVLEGDTLENLSFDGFVVQMPGDLAAEQSFVQRFDLQSLRNLGFKYAIINGSTSWCMPCRQEAQAFVAGSARWADSDGVVLSILTEDVNLAPASTRTLDQWVAEFGVNYSMVHDPRGEIDRVLAPSSYPVNFVVDLQTMTILRATTGLDDELFTFWEATLSRQ